MEIPEQCKCSPLDSKLKERAAKGDCEEKAKNHTWQENRKESKKTYSTALAAPKAIETLVFQVRGLLKSSDTCRNS